MTTFSLSPIPAKLPEPELQFTGFFIPVEIINLPDLNWIERIALAMIDALDGPKHCYASNEYLAEKLEITPDRVSKIITKLKRKKLIEQVEFNGRVRRLKSLKNNWFKKSKNKLPSEKTSQTRQKHLGRPGENTYEIEKKIIKKEPPLTPPTPEPKRTAAQEEEEKNLDLLKQNPQLCLSPSQSLRLAKSPHEKLLRAIEISHTIKPKKGFMNLLCHILAHPEMYDSGGAETKPTSQSLARKHNETLRKSGYSKEAKENEATIPQGYMKVMVAAGLFTTISLNYAEMEVAFDIRESERYIEQMRE